MCSISRMRFSRFITLALFAAVLGLRPLFAVTLSEIMFDPTGNEGTDEFIELFIDGLTAVNLQGWTISDGESVDSLLPLNQGTIALSGQYVLIMDPDYFEDGSTTYDGRVPESALVLVINDPNFGSRGLSNSNAESWTLYDRSGNPVSSYRYSTGNRAGYSDEKILPDGGDHASNWADAAVLHGTPGARNSVTPPDRDLAIIALRAEPAVPAIGDSFSLNIEVVNNGRMPRAGGLQLFELPDPEFTDSLILLREWQLELLHYGDSAAFDARRIMRTSAGHVFRAQLTETDDDTANNSRVLIVGGSGIVRTIQFNEIMYMPEPQLPEWIEIVNRSSSPQNLQGWSLADGTGLLDSTRRFMLPPFAISPNNYVLLAADSAIYFMGLPPDAAVAVWNSAAITLNNNGDSLVLFDAAGQLIDRMDYRPSWGGAAAGTSLERIASAIATNDPLNWASSLDSSGSTPGRLNSRALPASGVSAGLLELHPNPFSPDGDGHEDLLAIRCRFDHADSRLDLKIYDIRGRLVRRLANNEPAGYSSEYLWDGRGDDRRELPTGLYIVYLEALGKGGTRIQSAHRAVALARRS